MPIGEAIERAWRLLLRRTTGAGGSEQANRPVWLDEVTARLLDTRFEVDQADTHCFMLRSERVSIDPARPLLGRPTPCVGRDRELALLDSLFTECRDEPVAQAALVIAPAGFGKSRVRHEFIRRLQGRQDPVEILIGRGDPMSMGTPYGILGQAIRRLCEMTEGEPAEIQQKKLMARLGKHVPAAEAQRVTEFIGELCGVPFPADANPPLRAARQDPRIMSDQIQQAMLDWLRAECSVCPLVLVLDDLHWGDPLTVALLDMALRELSEISLMVLALARPEVSELFPKLWSERKLLELRLDGLPRKASERLIQHVLGKQASEQMLARLVAQAAGNPLFLEELIRASVEHKDELPETVLAMLQARLMRLEPEARRVLRAASVFGATFWRGGALLHPDSDGDEAALDRWLQRLIRDEIIERHRHSRIADEVQYGFRHALMRDAVYGLLTESERQRGHQSAGLFLEPRAIGEPLMIAEHFQRSDVPVRAVPWFLRAAEQAMAVHDLTGTLRSAESGVACKASGEQLGRLCSLQAWAHIKLHDYQKGYQLGKEAVQLLPIGSRWWCESMSALFTCAGLLDPSAMPDLLGRFAAAQPVSDALGKYIEAGAYLVIMFSMVGQRAPAQAFLGRIQQLSGLLTDADASARGWLNLSAACYFYYLEAHIWESLSNAQEADKAFQLALDQRNRCFGCSVAALNLMDLGDTEEAERILRGGVETAKRVGDPMAQTNLQTDLAYALSKGGDSDTGKAEEAMAIAQEVVQVSGINPFDLGRAHIVIARLTARQKQYEVAEQHARKACELTAALPSAYFPAAAALTEILLAQGRNTEARDLAEGAYQRLRDLGGCGSAELPLLYAMIRACLACGDAEATEQAREFTRTRIHARAHGIPNAAQRERYLAHAVYP